MQLDFDRNLDSWIGASRIKRRRSLRSTTAENGIGVVRALAPVAIERKRQDGYVAGNRQERSRKQTRET